MLESDLTLSWGIISTGRICQDFCTALNTLKTPKHTLHACASRNLKDSNSFATRFSIPNFYDSYEELIRDKNVNIVYIGTVSSLHKSISIMALNAGKHVLCEKPMCLNLKEMEEVLEAARVNGRFFMEAIWTRHFPLIERLKEEIRGGSIGRVKLFSSDFTGTIPMKSKELGGGAIYDIGIYPIQLACIVFNNEIPLEITATGNLLESGVDESSTICLKYSGNRMAVINLNVNAAFYAPTRIIGETGIIKIPNNSFSPTELILSNGDVIKSELPPCVPTNFPNSIGLGFQAEATRVAISKGLLEHPKMTHNDSRLICQIMDEARRQLGYI